MKGGSGNDSVFVKSSNASIVSGDGKDTITISGKNNKIDAGDDRITVTCGSNTIGAVNDKIVLSDNNKNTVIYTAGNDTITGYRTSGTICLAEGVTQKSAKVDGKDLVLTANNGTLHLKDSADKNINLLYSSGKTIALDLPTVIALTDSLQAGASNAGANVEFFNISQLSGGIGLMTQ